MYITNPEAIKHKYTCNKREAEFLMKNNFSLLSNKEDKFYFSETEELKTFIKNINWLQRLLFSM
jgi:hypothetical protein